MDTSALTTDIPRIAMHIPSEVADESSLRKVVKECLDSSKRDYEAALKPLIRRVSESKELTEAAIYSACRYLLRQAVFDVRAATQREEFESPVTPSGVSRRVTNDKILSSSNAWLDYPLPLNCGSLGNATCATLKRVIEFYGQQEAGMRRERKFYEAVGKKVPDGKRVREVLSNAQLKKLRGESK